MHWMHVLGVILTAGFIALYEQTLLRNEKRRMKVAFYGLLSGSCGLAILLLFYPEIPDLTEWLNDVFKPLARFLE